MKAIAATLGSLVLLAGCATATDAPSGGQSMCEWTRVPQGAVMGARQGMDTATYPPAVAPGQTACQRVWYGDRARPEAMQVLATYYFEQGRVRRLVGRVPGGAEYDCHYRDGNLDAGRSRNPGQCPEVPEPGAR